jgi:DNA-binding SARP family transcriptional activator/TolB-like protein/Flp pilus assembly protein TadD
MAGIPNPDRNAEKAPNWFLQLCGKMEAIRPDGVSASIPGRRERALLAYLALARNFRESRRNLITLLWGDGSDKLALDNLRTCLWSLRKVLGDQDHDLIQSEREWIGLNGRLIEVGVLKLRTALRNRDIDELSRTLQNESGPLLDGLELDSTLFQDWIRDERRRHSQDVVEALLILMSDKQAKGLLEEADVLGRRVLEIDPFCEKAVRGLMRGLCESGRRHLALQCYRDFAQKLECELQVQPEAATQALYEKIAGMTGHMKAESAAAADIPSLGESRLSVAPEESSILFQESIASETASGMPPERVAKGRALRIGAWILGIAFGVALGALIAVGIIFWRVPALAPAPFGKWINNVKGEVSAGPPRIAVLPFQGYGEQGAADFADALSEGITSALSITSEMFVVARSSVMRFKDATTPPSDIAEQLGVRYLLEGSVTRYGDSISIRTALIDTREGSRAEPMGNYTRPLEDYFKIQQDVTLEVVTALQVRLTEGEQERIGLAHGTENFQAWLLASQGHKRLRRLDRNDNQAARKDFQKALALDPNFTRALTGLAWTYLYETQFGPRRDAAALLERAAQLAERAFVLDAQRAGTLSLIGTLALFSGEFELARKMGQRAVELEYNDSDAAALLALTLTYVGEPRRALGLVERAIQLKPHPPLWYEWLRARAYRLAGDPEMAATIIENAGWSGSDSPLPLVELALAYEDSGNRRRAREVFVLLKIQHPEFSTEDWAELPRYEDERQGREERHLLRAIDGRR